VTRIAPLLCTDDAAAAISFYQTVFDATVRMRFVAPDGRIGHAELVIGDALVMVVDDYPELGLRPPTALGGASVSVAMYVADVDAVVERAVAAGATVVRPVENRFYGDRNGQVVDPFGHVWAISTHIEDVLPEEIRRRAATPPPSR
jgi:PhnB protein